MRHSSILSELRLAITRQPVLQEVRFEQSEYTFYDKEGNVIGVASDYLEELDEGKTWKFDVEYVGASSGDIISYELTGLEGF